MSSTLSSHGRGGRKREDFSNFSGLNGGGGEKIGREFHSFNGRGRKGRRPAFLPAYDRGKCRDSISILCFAEGEGSAYFLLYRVAEGERGKGTFSLKKGLFFVPTFLIGRRLIICLSRGGKKRRGRMPSFFLF